MSDTYGFPFGYFYSNDPKTKAPISWQQLEARRKIAAALASRARPYPKTIGEGLTYAGEQIGSALEDRRLARDELAASEYEDTVRRSVPGATSSASPAVDAVATLGSAVQSGTSGAPPPLPGAQTPSVVQQAERPQPPPVQPQQPQRPVPQPPPQLATAMNRAFDERGVPPEQRPYYNTLAYGESRFNPDAVSPTGARGPFQFTRGTARQYGLANPSDPYASTLAAIDLTGDNRRVMTQRLGREPTDAELALGHNQGATGASNLLSGRTAPANNLAVNGVPPGMPPQQAAAFLQNKLGFGGSRDPRAAVAASLTATASAPPAVASEGGAGPATSDPQPRVQLASAAPGGPVQAAPPLPTPNQRIAQAPPSPAAQVLGPMAADREPPRLPGPDATEMYYRTNAVNGRLSPTARAEFTMQAEQLQRRREAEHAQRMEAWKLYRTERAADVSRRDAFDLGQDKRQSELATAQQSLEENKLKSHGIIGDEKYAATIRGLPGHTERLQRIQNLVQGGVYSGLSAPLEMTLARTRAAVGGAADPKIARTEQLQSDLAAIAGMQRLDVVGPGAPSDKDMELLQNAAAGKITLTTETIREVTAAAQKLQLSNAIQHQRKLEQFANENPELAQQVYARYGLPMEAVVPKSAIAALLKDASDPSALAEFNQTFHTPGLAERIIARTRRP